jgi:hypothetical protein
VATMIVRLITDTRNCIYVSFRMVASRSAETSWHRYVSKKASATRTPAEATVAASNLGVREACQARLPNATA